MNPQSLGGHPAIDFLNTASWPNGQLVETVGNGRALLDWFVMAELLDPATGARLTRRFGARALDRVATEARTFREWARAWLTRWREASEADYTAEIAVLNQWLGRGSRSVEVVSLPEGLKLVEHQRVEHAGALLSLLALQIARLIAEEKAALVKQCAGSACTLWFVDRTKGHHRLFCSAATCGNRARVSAFRERQRRG